MTYLYAVDYNPDTKTFEALFAHGTSSANLPSIAQHGLRRTDYDRAFHDILNMNPALLSFYPALDTVGRDGILGVKARNADHHVVVSTWFANSKALQILTEEIGRVAPHGGEIYSVVYNRVTHYLRKIGASHELPIRLPSAQPALVYVKVPFRLRQQCEMTPRTHTSVLNELAADLPDQKRRSQNWNFLREVKFVDPIPVEHIAWLGPLDEGCALLRSELLSPSAMKALDDA